MAIDGTLDEVADSPANALHFARLSQGANQSAFAQMRCLSLAEAGTHAIIDAVAARCKASEQTLCATLLRSIEANMLVMTDRHFLAVNWITSVQQRGAHVSCRLAAGLFREPSQRLADGSYLVTIHAKRKTVPLPLILRVIGADLHPLVAADLALLPTSRTSNPAKPQQRHRLLTTLLDPEQAPALQTDHPVSRALGNRTGHQGNQGGATHQPAALAQQVPGTGL